MKASTNNSGIDPETFAEIEAVLHDREARKCKSGCPPASPVGAPLLLTLEFWREYRTYFHLGRACGMHETTVLLTVVRVEDTLLKRGSFFLPGKKTLGDAGTVLKAVVVNVSGVPCERPKKSSGTGTAGNRNATR